MPRSSARQKRTRKSCDNGLIHPGLLTSSQLESQFRALGNPQRFIQLQKDSNVNGGRQPARQNSAADAAATAQRYVAAGYSVDLGLGQINSRNMRWLGLTWDNVFDPCTNVAALARVLTTNYNSVKVGRDPQTALRVALSMYNTGSQTRGFHNGYVAKVERNAVVYQMAAPSVPLIGTAAASAPFDQRSLLPAANAVTEPLPAQARQAPPPKWNVFERAAYDRETRFLAENERPSI